MLYQNVLYCSLFIFATGSLLCGAARVRSSLTSLWTSDQVNFLRVSTG